MVAMFVSTGDRGPAGGVRLADRRTVVARKCCGPKLKRPLIVNGGHFRAVGFGVRGAVEPVTVCGSCGLSRIDADVDALWVVMDEVLILDEFLKVGITLAERVKIFENDVSILFDGNGTIHKPR